MSSPSSSCPLCDVDPSKVVLENKYCLFTQDSKYQGVLRHSGLIVPRSHRETVFDLTPEEVSDTFALLAQVRAHLDLVCRPDGFTLGWSCYPVGGQTIMHAHLHVLPRFADEPFAGRGLRWWLKQPENQRP